MRRDTWKVWRDEEDQRIALNQAEILMKMAEEEGEKALAAAKADDDETCMVHRDRQSALENGARALGIILPD